MPEAKNETNSEITIVTADDHPVFRRGLNMIIASESDFNVIAEAQDGAQAVEMIKRFEPDVAVLDVNMPEMNGFDTVRNLREINLATEIIFLTMHKDETMFNTAMDLGVKGYLLKESAIDDIAAGIRAVAAGRHFISPTLTTFLISRSNRTGNTDKPNIESLTKTERLILKLISEEKTSREIGEMLFTSVRTVERHRQNICNKLEIRGSNVLLKFAVVNKHRLL